MKGRKRGDVKGWEDESVKGRKRGDVEGWEDEV